MEEQPLDVLWNAVVAAEHCKPAVAIPLEDRHSADRLVSILEHSGPLGDFVDGGKTY